MDRGCRGRGARTRADPHDAEGYERRLAQEEVQGPLVLEVGPHSPWSSRLLEREQRPELGIPARGDDLLRRRLLQCAHAIPGPFGPDTELRRSGLRMAERGGKRAKRRAVVAVARKLAVLLHRLWVTGEAYQPLGYGKAEAPAA